MQKLPRAFYARDTALVARELLGMLLVHRVAGIERVARIVEVEAYLGPHDMAAHTSKGITDRTRVMFGPPGHAYVYLIYGMHHCMNVVTEPVGHGSAVLLRALEPLHNVSANTRGPGLLCKAMAIDRSLTGHDLLSDDLYLAAPALDPTAGSAVEPASAAISAPPISVVCRPRIGVAYAGEWALKPLRFYIEGNPFVSKK